MADQFTGKVLADKYRLGPVVTTGDAGDVYSGVNVQLERPVLVKVLSPELAVDENIRAQFFEQARQQSHISNLNVLNVHDFGTAADGTGYIVFEGSADETLANAIRTHGRMQWPEAVGIARQAASALAAGHMAGTIHGNLTPEKILITIAPDGSRTAKVYDFGSANPLTSGEVNEQSVTEIAYLAPEQCSGSEVADSRSDIYALGVILYEMLAGEPPFTGEKPTAVMLKHIEEPPAPLSAFRHDLPPTIEPVVVKALAKDPELRYQTAAEVEQELFAIESGGTTAAAAAGGNNLWKTAFIVLAGIALLSAFLIYATSSRQTDPTTALQPDANGQPVQPINPATGAEEQSLVSMPGMLPENMGNANVDLPPGAMPGGDGYNPWGAGTAPPPGAPTQYIGPGGQVYTIDPNTGSPFMAPEGGVVLVPVPVNTNTAAKPSPTPKTPPANANIAQTPAPDATTKPSPVPAKPTPAPTKAPAQKPTQKPAANKPAAGTEAGELEQDD